MTPPTLDADLVIAGAGPAGLATAILATRAGLRCVVVEPRTGPIDKACGEGLMPGAVRALRALDVEIDGRPFRGIRYLDGAHRAEALFPGEPGMGVRRTVLQDALRARIDALGITVLQGRVSDVRQGPGWVGADGLTARYLVAADGLHSPVRAALGLGRPTRRPARYGVRRHYACAPWTDLVEVHWGRSHEVYVTPVGDHLVGVAVLGTRGVRLDAALSEHPELRTRLENGERVGADRGAGPLRQVVHARRAGRVLLVGDAAGYVDAVTGEGITLALDEAAAAVRCLVDDDPGRYERQWRRLTARYRLGTDALVLATRVPAVRRGLVPAAARFPRVFARCVAEVAGPAARPDVDTPVRRS